MKLPTDFYNALRGSAGFVLSGTLSTLIGAFICKMPVKYTLLTAQLTLAQLIVYLGVESFAMNKKDRMLIKDNPVGGLMLGFLSVTLNAGIKAIASRNATAAMPDIVGVMTLNIVLAGAEYLYGQSLSNFFEQARRQERGPSLEQWNPLGTGVRKRYEQYLLQEERQLTPEERHARQPR